MKTFFPRKAVRVDASSHTEEAEYVIGAGNEMWGAEAIPVLKVQMSYGGRVAGRKAPSFPITNEERYGTSYDRCEDFDEVIEAAERVIQPLRKWLITWDRPPNQNDVSAEVCKAIKLLLTLTDEDLLQPCYQVRVVEVQYPESGQNLADDLRETLRKLKAPAGISIYVARLATEGESRT